MGASVFWTRASPRVDITSKEAKVVLENSWDLESVDFRGVRSLGSVKLSDAKDAGPFRSGLLCLQFRPIGEMAE
jgi:hypothetical protein